MDGFNLITVFCNEQGSIFLEKRKYQNNTNQQKSKIENT